MSPSIHPEQHASVLVILMVSCYIGRCGIVVSTSAWHTSAPGSIPGHDRLGMFGVKTWLSTLGTVYPSYIGESH